MGVLATGVPAWPEIEPGFDLSPLLLVLTAFVVAPLIFRIRQTWRSLGALAAGILALTTGAALTRRRHPPRG